MRPRYQRVIAIILWAANSLALMIAHSFYEKAYERASTMVDRWMG